MRVKKRGKKTKIGKKRRVSDEKRKKKGMKIRSRDSAIAFDWPSFSVAALERSPSLKSDEVPDALSTAAPRTLK